MSKNMFSAITVQHIKCFENIFAEGANELLSIICVCRRRCHRRKLFTFLSYSVELQVQFQPCKIGTKIP